ncbi:hypothetical protein [Thauera aminoaromatica]|uniref:Uncharacterized protein n=1 Tax=Thauera aminoaromatica TaxID=164330 RepID=A0A5C7SKL4_THASP|nr:hypothetical protein [Thauera aminoaromatica]TXH83435.1 MAG: hypothetical protein E6Q80_13575 [Thauera aminoaromatica]
MAERHFLHLDSAGLRAARVHRGQVGLTDHITAADGPPALAAWLKGHPQARCTLLVDLPDETYQLDTLPVVGPRDRRQLIARRQAQLGLDTPYITHQPLGQSVDSRAGGPPQEKILFAALNRPAALQTWLTAFEQGPRALDGVHLASHLAAALAPQLPDLPPLALLVWASPAGLRVSCLDGGRLRFSRLTPASTFAGIGLWQTCHDEARRTHQYLVGQRAIDRTQTTPVYVLAHPQDHAALGSACPDSGELRFQAVDLPALARRCGLHSPIEDSDSLPLLLHLASRSRHLPQLAPFVRGRPRHLSVPATAFGVLAASLLAVSLVITAHNLFETNQLRQQADSALTESLAEEARTRARQAATPRLPLPGDALQADFTPLASLHPFGSSLTAFLHRLADALETLPGVELTALEWSLAPDTPQPGATAIVELRLPASPNARPDLIPHVLTTLRDHTGSPAHGQAASPPDEQGPLRSADGQADADGRRALRVELPVSAP